jgi:hypothetical protein
MLPGRVRVRDERGRTLVARVHGRKDGRLVVLLPDGQLASPDADCPQTDDSFRPATFDEVGQALKEGPFRDFQVEKTDHFLVVYECSESFAVASARLLESLYKGLSRTLACHGLPVHEPEFPLVAVIFRDELSFRRYRPVSADIQAYYDRVSNWIVCYETSRQDFENPEIALLRKPQTIAHEGTHQVLQNIGVQPRLTDWPLWLVEGLAEYCAPTITRRGAEWAGWGKVNPLHMATLGDLREEYAARSGRGRPGRAPTMPLAESIVTRTEFHPTDYALAWALTHYLATNKAREFVRYLEAMGRMAPHEVWTPGDHLDAFRDAFGSDLAKIDQAVARHLKGLTYEPLPYYLVTFEQELGGGFVRRAALVSQSPTQILKWLDEKTSPHGFAPRWWSYPYTTRPRACQDRDLWLSGQWNGPPNGG